MEVIQVLDELAITGSGSAVKIGDFRLINGAIPIMVYGTFTGTVVIEGTIAHDDEVIGGTATWIPLVGGSFTTEGIMGLFSPVSHIRGSATLSAGKVSIRAYL